MADVQQPAQQIALRYTHVSDKKRRSIISPLDRINIKKPEGKKMMNTVLNNWHKKTVDRKKINYIWPKNREKRSIKKIADE